VKEYLIRTYSTKSDKIAVIPLGIDRFTKGEPERQRSTLGTQPKLEEKNVQEMEKKEKNKGKECSKILYVGRIAPNKGIHILLKAFENICKIFPAELLIVGGFTEDYSYYYNHAFEEASSLPVKFLGRVREEEKIRHYQEADIFVETGVLNKDVAFVYPREDAEALSSAISEALTLDWNKRNELKDRAKSFLENFRWERHITELERVMFEMKWVK
jgi:glycosyltransferase involved in cell wall biosynthesis